MKILETKKMGHDETMAWIDASTKDEALCLAALVDATGAASLLTFADASEATEAADKLVAVRDRFKVSVGILQRGDSVVLSYVYYHLEKKA